MRIGCEILIYVVIILVFRIRGAKVTKNMNDQLYRFDRSTEELIEVVKKNGNGLDENTGQKL